MCGGLQPQGGNYVPDGLVRCGSCGATNRVPTYSVSVRPKCGKCGRPLTEPNGAKLRRFIHRNRYRGPITAAVVVLVLIVELRANGVNLSAVSQSAVKAISPPPPPPVCETRPVNGQIIGPPVTTPTGVHTLTIKNGSDGDAIVKVRDAVTGRAVVSFFVAANATTTFDRLRDGKYQVQFAVGGAMTADCKTFIQPRAVKMFPEDSTFGQPGMAVDELTYSLYSMPSGNVMPKTISISDFNAD